MVKLFKLYSKYIIESSNLDNYIIAILWCKIAIKINLQEFLTKFLNYEIFLEYMILKLML